MRPKFKIGDKVKIGNPDVGYDIAQILKIDDSPFLRGEVNYYTLKILTRKQYFNTKNLYLAAANSIYYEYPLADWVMEHVENALQKLKRRLLNKA